MATPTPKPSPSSTPRVGGNKYTPGAVQPQPVVAPAQTSAGLNPQSIAQIQEIVGITLSQIGTTGAVTPAYNYTLLESMSDTELTDIARLLKKM